MPTNISPFANPMPAELDEESELGEEIDQILHGEELEIEEEESEERFLPDFGSDSEEEEEEEEFEDEEEV